MAARVKRAHEAAGLIGTWKLKSNVIESKTGDRRLPQGKRPNGYLIFTAEGRLMVLFTSEGREAARTEAQRSALFNEMVAYSGIYRVENDRFITRVDVSWNKWWNGTEHVRYFRITGNRLDISSEWEPIRPVLGSPLVRGIAVWERAV